MPMKDYYAVLEVAPEASDKEIKKAYRKLARQYHPDVNVHDASAEERFKDINEAYQTLGDPEKRRRYDELRTYGPQWQHAGDMGGANWGQWHDAAGGRAYTQSVSPEDLKDMFGGDIFSDIFGGAFRAGAGGQQYARGGQDIDVPVEISLQEAAHGARRAVQVGDRRIEARIPAGVSTGSRVRLAGQGHPDPMGGSAGDLYLIIEVQPDERFTRHGDNLETSVPVDMYTAAVGGEVRVPTLEGNVRLKIPPRTQAGKKFRLREKGMPRLNEPTKHGDLYAVVELVLPDELSDDELDALRELAQRRHEWQPQPA